MTDIAAPPPLVCMFGASRLVSRHTAQQDDGGGGEREGHTWRRQFLPNSSFSSGLRHQSTSYCLARKKHNRRRLQASERVPHTRNHPRPDKRQRLKKARAKLTFEGPWPAMGATGGAVAPACMPCCTRFSCALASTRRILLGFRPQPTHVVFLAQQIRQYSLSQYWEGKVPQNTNSKRRERKGQDRKGAQYCPGMGGGGGFLPVSASHFDSRGASFSWGKACMSCVSRTEYGAQLPGSCSTAAHPPPRHSQRRAFSDEVCHGSRPIQHELATTRPGQRQQLAPPADGHSLPFPRQDERTNEHQRQRSRQRQQGLSHFARDHEIFAGLAEDVATLGTVPHTAIAEDGVAEDALLVAVVAYSL